mmetsp:Transcript_15299/g.13014  ORF Transcript_15299/g.13014 Transcript_15299/m.13014 type:complete len:92 (+) Transcript_15299:34-309(+)
MNKTIITLFALTFIASTYATVQTGKFTKGYPDQPFVTEPNNERTDIFVAKFKRPFEEVPKVEVGLYGIDLDFRNAGIFVEVVKVTPDGFKV